MKKRKNVQVTKLTRVSLNLNGEFVTNNPKELTEKLHKWLSKHGVARAKISVSSSDRLDTGRGVPGVNWKLGPTVRQQRIVELTRQLEVRQLVDQLVDAGIRSALQHQNGSHTRTSGDDVKLVHEDVHSETAVNADKD